MRFFPESTSKPTWNFRTLYIDAIIVFGRTCMKTPFPLPVAQYANWEHQAYLISKILPRAMKVLLKSEIYDNNDSKLNEAFNDIAICLQRLLILSLEFYNHSIGIETSAEEVGKHKADLLSLHNYVARTIHRDEIPHEYAAYEKFLNPGSKKKDNDVVAFLSLCLQPHKYPEFSAVEQWVTLCESELSQVHSLYREKNKADQAEDLTPVINSLGETLPQDVADYRKFVVREGRFFVLRKLQYTVDNMIAPILGVESYLELLEPEQLREAYKNITPKYLQLSKILHFDLDLLSDLKV